MIGLKTQKKAHLSSALGLGPHPPPHYLQSPSSVVSAMDHDDQALLSLKCATLSQRTTPTRKEKSMQTLVYARARRDVEDIKRTSVRTVRAGHGLLFTL